MRKSWADVMLETFGEIAYREVLLDDFETGMLGSRNGSPEDVEAYRQAHRAARSLLRKLESIGRVIEADAVDRDEGKGQQPRSPRLYTATDAELFEGRRDKKAE